MKKDLIQNSKGKQGKEDTLFFAAWLKHGRNATKAYKELHPNVTDGSARVLGARQLTNIDIPDVLAAYDLSIDRYLAQLDEGLSAVTVEGSRTVPDHRTRAVYHERLGKMLGLAASEMKPFPIVAQIIKDKAEFGF